MAELRFGVLGPLEVYVDGRARTVSSGRQRAVLSCLLVHAGRPVSADVLIDAAWDSDLPQEPHRALRTVLSRLRSRLGHGAVEMLPSGYRLTATSMVTDAAEFEELLELAAGAEPKAVCDLLGRALALWRGPAYDEYGDAPYATAAVQRLERQRADATEAYAAALIQVGDSNAAVGRLDDLLAEQPFREHAVELLARALYYSGRQTEALQRLRTYRGLLVEELGLDPSPMLDSLEERVLGHALTPARPAPSEPPHWLDISTAFIGREDQFADLAAAVIANQVTVVTGPGGVGKSRLVAEALGSIHAQLGMPTAITELLTVPVGHALVAVADSLGIRANVPSLDADLLEYLTAVPHLLVLDNCEHVLDEIAPLVAVIARRCREVRVLVTSRRRLGVPSELVLPLDPLGVPDSGSELGTQNAVASVRLFVDRVRRSRPAFTLGPSTTTPVAELCRRCDGLPLALELAASRAATSGVDEVLMHLPADLESVSPGGLRSVVEWSANLLDPQQRELLSILSVFAGDFTADDVRGLTEDLALSSGDIGPNLVELVESSLVAERFVGASVRYRLLEIVRAYAAHSLSELGQTDDARRVHAQWVRGVVARIRADWARAENAGVALRLMRASAEVAAALRWALEAGRLEVAADISHSVARCLHLTPGLEVLDLMIAVANRCADEPSPHTAVGIAAGAFFTSERGDTDRSVALASMALQAAQQDDHTVMALLALAVSAMYAGDLAASARWFRTLAEIPEMTGEANASLALIACYRDDLAAARDHVRIALAAGGSESEAKHAFARYAAGELAARFDSARGADLLADAAAAAERVCAEQVSRVSRVALFALLVRGKRQADAASLGLPLIGDLRRRGAWNQAWTMMRLLAELMADSRRFSDAAFLLAAAAAASSAPPPVGRDVPRYAALQRLLSRRLGPHVTEQIGILAAATPRAHVLSRGERLLADMSAGQAHPAEGTSVGELPDSARQR